MGWRRPVGAHGAGAGRNYTESSCAVASKGSRLEQASRASPHRCEGVCVRLRLTTQVSSQTKDEPRRSLSHLRRSHRCEDGCRRKRAQLMPGGRQLVLAKSVGACGCGFPLEIDQAGLYSPAPLPTARRQWLHLREPVVDARAGAKRRRYVSLSAPTPLTHRPLTPFQG
jgi:hypothetical protein